MNIKEFIGLPVYQWKEPVEISRALRNIQNSKTSAKRDIISVIIVSSVMMVIWFSNSMLPNKSTPTWGLALLGSVLLGLFVVYVVPRLNGMCGRVIRVNKTQLWCAMGNIVTVHKLKDIEEINKSAICGYVCLTVRLNIGTEFVYGVDPKVNIDEILDYIGKQAANQAMQRSAGLGLSSRPLR